MKNKITCIFLILFSLLVYGQKENDSAYVVEEMVEVLIDENADLDSTDSLLQHNYKTENTVFPKTFSKDFQKKYTDDDFNYDISKPKESIWQKIKKKLAEIIAKIFSGKKGNNTEYLFLMFLRVLAIIAIGGLLYIIVRYIMERQGTWILSKKGKTLNPEAQTITENIHELDLPALIRKYEESGKYRYAIRYHFLLLLKKMTDKKIIQWDPEKTNGEYLRKIQGTTLYPEYRKLFYIFDHIWYGERNISQSEYEKYKQNFQQIFDKL